MSLSRILSPMPTSSAGNHALAALNPVPPSAARQFADKAGAINSGFLGQVGQAALQRGRNLAGFNQAMQRKKLLMTQAGKGSAAKMSTSAGQKNGSDAAPVAEAASIVGSGPVKGLGGNQSPEQRFKTLMNMLSGMAGLSLSGRLSVHGFVNGAARS